MYMNAASMANTLATVLLLAGVAMIISSSGVYSASLVTGTVFCDQCRDGYVSLFDYPLSGVKVAMLCPTMGGIQAISQETTNIFGTYTMRFDGTPNFGNCYTQVVIQQQQSGPSSSSCQASAGPSKPPRLTFSFFGIEYFAVEPLISQPIQPLLPFCSGWTGSIPRPPSSPNPNPNPNPNPKQKPYPSPPSGRPPPPPARSPAPSAPPPPIAGPENPVWPSPSPSPSPTTNSRDDSVGSPSSSPSPNVDPDLIVLSPLSSPSPVTTLDDSLLSPSSFSSLPPTTSPTDSSVSSLSPSEVPSSSPSLDNSDDDEFKLLSPPTILAPSMKQLLAAVSSSPSSSPSPSPCSHEYWTIPEYRCYWRLVKPDTRVSILFGSLAARKYGEDITLWIGLQGKGDAYKTLLRESITAFLNACQLSTSNGFPYTSVEVTQQLNLALSSSSTRRRVLLTALRLKRANSGHWMKNPSCQFQPCG